MTEKQIVSKFYGNLFVVRVKGIMRTSTNCEKKNKCEILARSGHTKRDDMKMARPICPLEFIDIGKPVFHHSNGQRNYGIIYFYICRPVNGAYETNDGTRRRDKSKKKKKKTRMH